MGPDISSIGAADPSFGREKMLPAALQLAVAGGCIDAYTWILHGVLANAQSANVVFLWIHAMAQRWEQAFRFVPSFSLGLPIAVLLFVLLCCASGRMTRQRA